MEGTPKMRKKSTLSLSSRLNNKRHSASPQGRLRTGRLTSNNGCGISLAPATPRSPSVMSVCSDAGIEYTPPHKKFNFDDSLDYSPHALDCSYSPSGLLSQTLAIESPEVSWKWNRAGGATTAATPDSAYAADSSFTSSTGCSSSEAAKVHKRSDAAQRLAIDKSRKQQRKQTELQQRKAEKLKMDEILKKRCAKLQEQLKEIQTVTMEEKEKRNFSKEVLQKPSTLTNATATAKICTRATTALQITQNSVVANTAINKFNDSFSDFFNDSISDCLLLEATQQLEKKIVTVTHTIAGDIENKLTNSNSKQKVAPTLPSTSTTNAALAVVTTPKSSSKEKRSSLYSKFLEDDSPDDWFVSLDEVILQATQNKTPRGSFQRYNSMPTDTLTTTTAGTVGEHRVLSTKYANSSGSNKTVAVNTAATAVGDSTKSLKRHASSNTLSPSSTSYRGHLINRQK